MSQKNFMEMIFLTDRFGMGECFEEVNPIHIPSTLDPKLASSPQFEKNFVLSKIKPNDLEAMLKAPLAIQHDDLIRLFENNSEIFGDAGLALLDTLEP